MSDVLKDLHSRGLMYQSTDQNKLEEDIASGPITFYCGFDPTAPSLHLGNLVQLLTMRRLQLAGHNPLVVVGGATGLIGDPRPSSERVLQDKEVVVQWVSSLERQISKFLSFDGANAARLVNNLDWTEPLSAIDFLRNIGKYFRISKMLSKDAVSSRLNSENGISYTEFSYQVLQGLDFLELYRNFGCTLQIGGSDQWGNLTAGSDLIHRVTGSNVHLLVTPLITSADGKKFGKSEGNAIWLDSNLTSPYAFYQYWINTDDLDVISRLKVFTFIDLETIILLEGKVASEPHLRESQRILAYEVTALVHGKAAAAKAATASVALFGKGSLEDLDLETLDAVSREVSFVSLDLRTASIVDILFACGLSDSKGAARRAVESGGIYVNNIKVSDFDEGIFVKDLLFDKYLLVRRGRKSVAMVGFSR